MIVCSLVQNCHQKKNRSFGGSSLDLNEYGGETVSPPQTVPVYVRSDSLPATSSDSSGRQPSMPPHPAVQYRYAGPGYWPMSYDVRLWAASVQHMQQYMMDSRHSEHAGQHYVVLQYTRDIGHCGT